MNNISGYISAGFQCPPVKADVPNVIVYRLIIAKEFDDNFKSMFVVKKEKSEASSSEYKKNQTDELECQSCGLSVFTNLNACNNMRKTIKKFKNAELSQGDIVGVGKIMNTPSNQSNNHCTWWHMETHTNISNYFKILEMVNLESEG